MIPNFIYNAQVSLCELMLSKIIYVYISIRELKQHCIEKKNQKRKMEGSLHSPHEIAGLGLWVALSTKWMIREVGTART